MSDDASASSAQEQAQDQADEHAEAMMAFILGLRSQGLTDQRVLNAVSTLPRPTFVQPEHASLAWQDIVLPIQCGQTITPPSLVALIAERLEVEPHHRVLEIGTGSGYLTAVLARLSRRVLTLDRWRTLITEAEERLRQVEILNVTMMVEDGSRGWAAEAPFDRIVLTASVEAVDDTLADQIAPRGRLILPIGRAGKEQVLTMLERRDDGLETTPIRAVRATPLARGIAHRL
jgi:protein-L-isoaspartate(D-aspartate) O-methyltransferase